MQYKWIERKLEWYTNHFNKIAIVPMGRWGKLCKEIFQNKLCKKDILCMDNYCFDNHTVFPIEREENWYDDYLYLITAENKEVCQEIETQLSVHKSRENIAKLFFL